MNIPIFETLREALYDDDKKLLSGVILEMGLSKNGNFYPRETISKAAPKFTGVKCFIDHQRDGNVGERSIRDVCGVVEECHAESGKLRTLIRISKEHDWIAAMIKEGILGDVSINALGRTRLSRRDGRVVREVTEISKAYSVDFVTEAAAGGHVGALLRESAGFAEGLRLIENMTLAELRESRPDLVDRLQEEFSIGPDPEKDAPPEEETTIDLVPLIEGVLISRNLPAFIAAYLKDHLSGVNLNGEDDPEQMIGRLVEGHLDYLGTLADEGMIRSLSVLDHLSDRASAIRKSTFNFLGLRSPRPR